MPTMFHQKRTAKRRCSSPRYFPRKVHISEEKVASDLGNLSICSHSEETTSLQQKDVTKYMSKPIFFNAGTQRIKCSQEIEDIIDIDSEGEEPGVTLKMLPEFELELRKTKRKILIPGSYTPIPRAPQLTGKELVLWKPPSGVTAAIQTYISNSENNGRNVEHPFQDTEQMDIRTPVLSELSISEQRNDCAMKTALLDKERGAFSFKAPLFEPKLQTTSFNVLEISPHEVLSKHDNICEYADVIMDVDT